MTSKEKIKNKYLMRTYGITLSEWKEISKHGCWICGRKEGRICQDHIHIKGFKKMKPEDKKKYLRASLCFMCNTSLKAFEKTVDGARNRKQLERTFMYFQVFKLKGEI